MLHAIPRWATGLLQRFDALSGNRVFALGGNQFRTIDLEQRLPLGDRLTGDIDVQALDVALVLGRDRIDAALVRFDTTGGTDHLVKDPQLGGFRPHTQLLHLLGTDLDLVGRCGIVVLLSLIDRDVIHPHRVLLGHRRSVRQPHRVTVEEQFFFFLGRFGWRAGDLCRIAMGSAATSAQPVTTTGGHGDRNNADGQSRTLVHRSSPKRRSISARRIWASTWALSWFCLACRIWRWASSKVAKSTFPVS